MEELSNTIITITIIGKVNITIVIVLTEDLWGGGYPYIQGCPAPKLMNHSPPAIRLPSPCGGTTTTKTDDLTTDHKLKL